MTSKVAVRPRRLLNRGGNRLDHPHLRLVGRRAVGGQDQQQVDACDQPCRAHQPWRRQSGHQAGDHWPQRPTHSPTGVVEGHAPGESLEWFDVTHARLESDELGGGTIPSSSARRQLGTGRTAAWAQRKAVVLNAASVSVAPITSGMARRGVIHRAARSELTQYDIAYMTAIQACCLGGTWAWAAWSTSQNTSMMLIKASSRGPSIRSAKAERDMPRFHVNGTWGLTGAGCSLNNGHEISEI